MKKLMFNFAKSEMLHKKATLEMLILENNSTYLLYNLNVRIRDICPNREILVERIGQKIYAFII